MYAYAPFNRLRCVYCWLGIVEALVCVCVRKIWMEWWTMNDENIIFIELLPPTITSNALDRESTMRKNEEHEEEEEEEKKPIESMKKFQSHKFCCSL